MKLLMSPKYLTLLLLVIQTTVAVLLMRKCQEGSKFLVVSVVVTTELVKILVATIVLLREKSIPDIVHECVGDKRDFLLMAIPGVLYAIQNTLLFVALANLSGAVYQITYQMKILSTGALSVVMLGKILTRQQWLGLLLLTIGVGLIQLQDDKAAPTTGDSVTGVIAVLFACLTSAGAGVYVEGMIKGSNKNVLVRTMQLALWGTAMGVVAAFYKDKDLILEQGFFHDYNFLVWLAILLQAVGGILIGFVMKYADNILKCFANATSIILTMLVEGGKGIGYLPGTTLVILATALYNIDNLYDKFRLFAVRKRSTTRSEAEMHTLVGNIDDADDIL